MFIEIFIFLIQVFICWWVINYFGIIDYLNEFRAKHKVKKDEIITEDDKNEI